jgi:hypothetical protein
MAFQIKFETDNAAFGDGNFEQEVARILKDVATKISNGSQDGDVYDVNGNKVGYFYAEPPEPEEAPEEEPEASGYGR